MRKSLYPKILTGTLLIGISIACNLLSPLAAPPETETPAPTASLTKTVTATPTASPQNSATPVPTKIIIISTPTPKFAPFCQPSSASIATPVQCQMPIAEQSSAYCEWKAPYNLIRMNEGSSYEVSTEDIQCKDAGTEDGKQLVSCTGWLAVPFEIKVCDPSCAIQPFPVGVTNCPEGINYNEQLHCCEREPIPVDGNCVVLSLQTRSCAFNCGEFTDQTTCEENAYACAWIWDYEKGKNVCQLKR